MWFVFPPAGGAREYSVSQTSSLLHSPLLSSLLHYNLFCHLDLHRVSLNRSTPQCSHGFSPVGSGCCCISPYMCANCYSIMFQWDRSTCACSGNGNSLVPIRPIQCMVWCIALSSMDGCLSDLWLYVFLHYDFSGGCRLSALCASLQGCPTHRGTHRHRAQHRSDIRLSLYSCYFSCISLVPLSRKICLMQIYETNVFFYWFVVFFHFSLCLDNMKL